MLYVVDIKPFFPFPLGYIIVYVVIGKAYVIIIDITLYKNNKITEDTDEVPCKGCEWTRYFLHCGQHNWGNEVVLRT